MNKNQIVLSVIGGVSLVVTLVLGYLSYSAWSEQSMMREDLDASESSIQRMRTAKVPPTASSVKALDDNRERLMTWYNEAWALASRGDWVTKSGLTAAAFKREMVDDAHALVKLPGAVNGALVAEGFGFGFPSIITGGSMPDLGKLAALQRQWAEVKLLVKTLADCGVAELTGVTIVDTPAESDLGKANDSAAKQNKKNRRNKKAASSSLRGEAEAIHLPTHQSYELRFRAKPAAFVRVLNALAQIDRFITVDDFTLARDDDALGAVLGGGKDKPAATSSRRGRRRRGAAATETPEDAKQEEAVKKGLVIDPATAAPLTVTLKLSTFDFGTASSNDRHCEERSDEAISSSHDKEEQE